MLRLAPRLAPPLIVGLALLALAACHRAPADVGGLSAEDAAQLDNAAETLDASPDGLSAPEDGNGAGGNEAGGNEVGGGR